MKGTEGTGYSRQKGFYRQRDYEKDKKDFNRNTFLWTGGINDSYTGFAQENSEGASLTKWCAVYGEAGGTSSVSPDSLNDGVMLLDNTILMAGTFDGSKTPDKEGVKGKTDGALVLYDDQGNMIWEKLTGGSKADSFNGAAQTGDGGFIAVGNTQSVDGDLEGQGKGAQDGLAALLTEMEI